MNIYEIVVKGHIHQERSGWFDGMTMELLPQGETLLKGEVTDQAALHAILTRIRDLGLPLLLVKKL